MIVASIASVVAGITTVDRALLGFALLGPLLDLRPLAQHRVMRSALLAQLLLYMTAFSSLFVLSVGIQDTRPTARRVHSFVYDHARRCY